MPPTDLFKGIQLVQDGPAFETLGLVHRVRVPANAGPHPTLVMIHGFQGNEDVTWVFARAAGPEWLIASPRAPFAAATGYSWHQFIDGHTDPNTFQQGLQALTRFVEGLAGVYAADRSQVVMLGFSQGAAMAYSFVASTFGTASVVGVAALSGYIPGLITLPRLDGLPILMLHGTLDDTIPIERARKDHEKLIAASASVDYREDPIAHKVSAAGMRELSAWLAERLIHSIP